MVLSVQDLTETEEGEQIGRKCDRTLSGVRQVCARKHTCPGEYRQCRANKVTTTKMEGAIMPNTESTIVGKSVNLSGPKHCFMGE